MEARKESRTLEEATELPSGEMTEELEDELELRCELELEMEKSPVPVPSAVLQFLERVPL